MARYFFNVRQDHDLVVDTEGDDFTDLEYARLNAVKAIREMAAAQIKGGEVVADERIEVVDETGAIVVSISFHDVIQEHLRR
jgi:hypothetical protein